VNATLMSTKDVARIYGVPYSKLRLWADAGRICEPERRGRELYWDPAEVEQMKALLGTRKRLPKAQACRPHVTQV
jgi:DNA-binding transcriptional MerR regulator